MTRRPLGPYSTAAAFTSPLTPNLLAQYADMPACAWCPQTLLVTTMAGLGEVASMSGIWACMAMKWPRRLTDSTRSNSCQECHSVACEAGGRRRECDRGQRMHQQVAAAKCCDMQLQCGKGAKALARRCRQ